MLEPLCHVTLCKRTGSGKLMLNHAGPALAATHGKDCRRFTEPSLRFSKCRVWLAKAKLEALGTAPVEASAAFCFWGVHASNS